MNNINIDDGKKSFTINGDTEKVISFNPTDPNIGNRILEALDAINKIKEQLPDDIKITAKGTVLNDGEIDDNMKKAILEVKRIDEFIKDKIDYMFDSDVSKIVFGNASSLSSINGKMFVERFLDALVPILKKEIEKENKASKRRVAGHLDKYKKNV